MLPEPPYDAIAEWYDRLLQENPIYQEVVLANLLALVSDVAEHHVCDLASATSPADKGSSRASWPGKRTIPTLLLVRARTVAHPER